MVFVYIIIGLFITGLFCWLIIKLYRVTPFPCQFCKNQRITRFKDLPDDLQHKIMHYFRFREKREPDTDGVFVCQECKTVFDDFSGEKKSGDIDNFGNMTWCKVCNTLMYGTVPGKKDITCPQCGTKYEWQTHEESGFRFLVPLTDKRLLEECDDKFGIA